MLIRKKKITNFDVIRHSMAWKLGLQESDPKKILEHKWNKEFFAGVKIRVKALGGSMAYWDEFTKYMQNRLIFGEFRYGRACIFELAGYYHDYQGYANKCFKAWRQDPYNLEPLIDAANCYYIHWTTYGFGVHDMQALQVLDMYSYYAETRKMLSGADVMTCHDKSPDQRLKRND